VTRGKLLSCSAVVFFVMTTACGYYRIVPRAMDPGGISVHQPLQINVPAKAHLKDGGVVLFLDGFRVDGGVLRGNGQKYDITRHTRALVQEVPLTEVAALEHYDEDLRPVLSTVASIPGSFVYIFWLAILVLLLGS